MFECIDRPVPFWRSYLRGLLGVPILHVYVSMPFAERDAMEDHTYDWYFTLGFKDLSSFVHSFLLGGLSEPSALKPLLSSSDPSDC